MSPSTVPVTIYHNPACGTSRNVLALIRNAGIEPTHVDSHKHTHAHPRVLRAVCRVARELKIPFLDRKSVV